MAEAKRIAVIGLGYVGLPLAMALARSHSVVGFDIDESRIEELRRGVDRTREVAPERLKASSLRLTGDEREIEGADLFIVTVPTPVDSDKEPDLSAVKAACEIVGRRLRPGAIVVFESTVYPGVTEEICGPLLEAAAALVAGKDFFLGYSPERINPGDPEHSVERITKVVAGQTPEVVAALEELYAPLTSGGVYVARDIRTAEAAKVIENAQRDINIAFVNEVAMVAQQLGLSAHDVLEAAGTKWNFLPFTPGLVGGHCIGVDPYYLAYRAKQAGHEPEVLLAGRRINDRMGGFIAERVADQLDGPARVLVLGLTFKENVPDLRNSRVVDIIAGLEASGHQVDVHDPMADPDEARELCGVELKSHLDGLSGYACLVGAVPHRVYRDFSAATFESLLEPGGLVADIKGMWRGVPLPDSLRRWQL